MGATDGTPVGDLRFKGRRENGIADPRYSSKQGGMDFAYSLSRNAGIPAYRES